MDKDAPQVGRLLSSWRADPTIANCIQAWRTIPSRPSQSSPFPNTLHPALLGGLRLQEFQNLYIHQVESWDYLHSGKNIVVVTGTASGKTLCYNLSVIDNLIREPQARALFLFPTKALTQDQAATQRNLIQAIQTSWTQSQDLSALEIITNELTVAIYDGDTPSHYRPAIRAQARLLLSNPDMLHIGILPHHTAWAEFFQHLKYVIIDEIHMYRGVFGSHVANVIRRLKRIASFYGSNPQFILTSATIANPKELAEGLIEEPVALVNRDGAAQGARNFLIYNPPIVDPDLGLRRSALKESVRLAEDLLTYDIQTIIFSRSRRSVEIILTYLRDTAQLLTDESDQPAVRGYRSGYLPSQRRDIEHGLRQGDVRAVIATNALELGVDIGGMGATVLVGYPGSIAATWQQVGRAGRGQEASLSVLVATADPLDQFLASHPDYFFERSPENALINPDNLLILIDHLLCASFELPFKKGEPFGNVEPPQLVEILDFLISEGYLHKSGGKYFWMADKYPAQGISLRSVSSSPVQLQTLDNEKPVTIGQVDGSSALWMVHPRAIYLHEARTYFVNELDLEANIARLKRIESDYYTLPRLETSVDSVELKAEYETQSMLKAHGEIQVTTVVKGFHKVRWHTHERLGIEDLTLPPTELLTTGYWLALTDETVNDLRQSDLWRNAPNDYGSNWAVQRDLARARDGFRCRICGIEEQGRVHDVHHKTPLRLFTSIEQANSLENLVSLCPGCHSKAETVVRVRSGLAGLAYVLGHLAPLFLMCDARDLGRHTDPSAPFTNGKPTVVLYDQVPAGIGFSQRLFEIHDEIISRAFELISVCPCNDGCPSCVGPGGEAGLGGKGETLAILERIKPPI